MKNRAILLLLTFLFINTLSAQNLLFNGDFQSGGNGVGFNTNGSGYTQISAPFSGTTSSGNFALTTNPQPMNTSVFLSFGDHTTGTGNMLIIDGNTTGGSQRFWEAGNGGSGVSGLTIGTTYKFSYWIRSASSTVIDAATSANIGIQIDNSSIPVLVSGSALAPLPGSWQKVVYSFVPTGSTVYIKLFNNNLNPVGNDFAVDDFTLTGPLAVTASSVNSTCAGANNGSISVYATGGVSPYATYSLSGTASQTNGTGVFSGLAPGTYNISVTDSTPTTVSQNGIVITEPTNPLVVSSNSSVCMPAATTLTVSGGSTYLWTASPADATLTIANNTNASPSVTPTQTTTYTVSSPVTTTIDLIANGNFSQGNTGFTSDYQYLNTTTAVGAQTTYGITTNSNSWFAGFSNCVDHTSGADKMIVFDGSTTNGGNNKLWSQTVPVIAGQNYTFSYWVQTVAATNPANIEVLINGASVGLALAPSATCGWTQVTYNWNSGVSTSAVISLYDRVISAAGNDFAIDDISFTTSITCTYTKTVTLTNKKPVISAKTVSICSNSSPNFVPVNTLPDIVPTGTTYTWSTPVISPAGSITGASAQATPQTSINQNLVNTTFANATVTYTVTADSETAPASCSSTFTLTITVKPNALIATKTVSMCSLDSFTVAPINSLVDIVPPGTTYTWSAPVILPTSTAITGGSAQLTPSTSISQTLVNTTSANATATYTVSTSTGSGANICTSTFQIIVTVLPRPAISTKVASICYSGTFTITPTNTLPDVVPTGTTYTWSAPVISPLASITGGSAQTTPVTSISQALTLTNISITNATATYTVTANSDPSSTSTCTRKFTIIVNVRPSPSITPKLESICSGATFTVTPSNTLPDVVPTGTTYTWAAPVISPLGAITGTSAQTNGLAYISQTLSNTTSAPATATYTVTASSGSGAAACTSTFTITVTVNPKPSIAAKTLSICKTGTINWTPSNTLPDIVPTGMTYTWTAPVIAPALAITGGNAQLTPVSSFTQTLNNVTAANATATYIVTAYSGTCTTTFNLVVTVSQGVSIANKTISICKTGTFNLTPTNTSPDIVPDDTTYTWGLPVITPLPITNITGATAQATGVTSISQTLTNVTAANAVATYTIIASSGVAPNICTTTFTLTVNVNQAVNIANIPTTICSKDTFTVTPTNNSPATNVVPTGTTYTWTTPVISPALAIIGGSAQPTPQTSISQTLTNVTAANATATYTVTASIGTGANICTRVFTVTVTVKPSANITEKSAIICSGSSFSITPTNTAPDTVPAGTTYTWAAPVIFPAAAITGGTAQAVGVATISQTLNNVTATIATATYTVTAKTGAAPACTNTFTIVVTVNPQPIISNKNITICGGSFTATPTNTLPDVVPTGTLYTWTTPVVFPVGSVSGASQQVTGISFVSQTLTRTGISASVPATVTYTITAKSGLAPSKCSTVFTLVVTVNPKPIIANKTASICKTGTFTISPTNTLPDVVPAGTTYTWPTPIISPVTAITGGTAQSTGQPNISQTLTNVTAANATATYTVTASYTNGVNVCSSTFTVVVSVNPTISISNKTLTYCKAATINYTPTNTAPDVIPDGTMYTWTTPVITPLPTDITGATAQTTPVASFNQILNNASLPPVTATAVYTVTATVGTAPNDCSTTFTVTVILNQGITIPNATQTTCSDSSISFIPANVPSGVTYSWGMPTFAPLASITGATAQVGQTLINQTLKNITAANATATYTITATSGIAPNDCSTTFQLVVTVKSAPSVVMTPSILQVCPGNSATLSFVATPNSIIRVVNSLGQTSNILTGATGIVNWNSPALNSTMVYTLLDIKRLSDLCTKTYTGVFCTVNVVPNGCATVSPGDTSTTATNATSCEVGKCFPLSMDYSPIASTTSYAVSSIPYCPQASYINPTWTQLYPGQVSGDDQWSPAFNLPVAVGNIPAFEFCFFGNNYTQINVGTNGVIAFPNPAPIAGGAFCPWSFNASVPNATLIRNAIFGVYQDTNYGVAVPLPDVLTANYSIVGTYPCRKFIVNFTNLPQFSCNLGVGLQTSQIVLYEVSNIIEVYVQNRTTCIGWNSGNGVIGIQNGAGTIGYTPPGRNTGSWNATNEAWRFTPNGAPVPVTFEWREGTLPTSPVISNSTDITVCPTVTTTYVAEAKYQVCGIEQKATKQYTITLNQDFTQEPVDLYNCGSVFNLNNVLPSVLGTLSAAGYTIKFHNTLLDAQDGVNAIALPTAYNGYNGETIYMSIKDFATNCSRVKSFQLFFATPSTVAVPNNLTYCVGSTIPISNFISTPSGATFDWTNDNTTIGLSNSFGVGNVPSFTATNPGVATITVTPTLNGCVGTPSTYTITVISGSIIANEVASICTTDTFTVTPSSALPNVIPAGTTYTWPAPVYSSTNVSGGSAQTTGVTSISQTLTNSNPNSNETATYTVTATSGTAPNTCTSTFTVTVTIKPSPTVTVPTSFSVCVGDIVPATNFTSTPIGATYTWSNSNPLIGISGTNVNGNITSFVATNSTVLPITGTISVTPTVNGCTGLANTYTITVNPKLSTTVSCGATTLNTVEFTWLAVSGATSYTLTYQVNSLPLVNVGDVGNVLTYTVPGLNPNDSVVIYVTPVGPIGSCFDVATATCVATPCLSITNPSAAQILCLNSDPSILSVDTTFTGANSISFVYFPTAQTGSNMYTGGILLSTVTPTAGIASYDPPTGALSNTVGTNYVYAIANPTPAGTVCRPFQEIRIDVISNPSIAPKTATICSGGTFSVTPANTSPDVVPTGTTYTWAAAPVYSSPNVNGGSAQITGVTSISQTLNNSGNTVETATYTVTATSGTAPNTCSSTFTVTVTVNPVPAIANVSPIICSGSAFSVSPVNGTDIVPSGTTYTWTVGTVSGINGASNQTTGVSIISQTLTNTTNAAINVIYTVTATSGTAPNTCSSTFTVTVTVNPLPAIANVSLIICSGSAFSVTPVNGTDIVPSGTTYTWTVGTVTGINGASNQTTGVSSISQTLTNTTNAAINVIYTVTATSGTAPNTCSSTFTVTVTVNPVPAIANVSPIICSGSAFSVSPVNGTDIVPSGTTYTWTVGTVTGINGASNQTTGVSSISQTLTNTTNAAINVIYTVTATSGTAPNTCSSTFTVTVTVNPVPAIANVSPIICSGSAFSVSPVSGTDIVPSVTTYTWTVGTVSGINGASNQTTGVSSISQTLTNTTNAAINVIYTVTATSGTAPNTCSSTFTVTVTVNPVPAIANVSPIICSGSAFSVSPVNGTDIVPSVTTYTWTVGTVSGINGASNQTTGVSSISQTLTNTTNAAINVIYTVTATSGTAPNTCSSTFTVTVTVNPKPEIANEATTICSGATFTVTPTNTGTNIIPAGTLYTWTVAPVTGITVTSDQLTGVSNISQTLSSSLTVAANVIYNVTATSGIAPNTCTDTFIVTVTVNPNPTVAVPSSFEVCAGDIVAATNFVSTPTGGTFAWTNTNALIGIGPNGNGNITSFIATNTTNTAISCTIQVTPTVSGCPPGTPSSYTITVNPKPAISNVSPIICSGSAFSVSPVNGTDIVPSGTTYTWTVGTVSGINGASNQTTGVSIISQTLTNTTNAAINVIYTVTATSGTAPNTCSSTFTVTVTVNPLPAIANVSPIICSGSAFSVSPVNGTDIVPSGTTYTWTVGTVSGINGASNQATGVSSISQTLTNTTNAAINVIYTVTATSGTAPNTCTNTFTVTVTVNPLPAITNKIEIICSGTAFTTTPVNVGTEIVPSNTLYTWTVAPVVGITGTSDELVGVLNSISQTLTNSTNAAINVIYNVTATSGTAPNACTDIFTVTVTVNPTPSISNKTETICSGTAFTTTPVSAGTEIVPIGTLYTWTVAPVVGITGTSDQTTGVSSISQTLTNSTNAPINVVYNVTATSGTAPNACTDTFTVTVTVNPIPSISNKTETICSGTAFTTTPVNVGTEIVPSNTLYTWTVAPVVGITGTSDELVGVLNSISQTLTNSTNAAINVVYNVTATSGTAPNACTDIFTVTVTVNPTPSISNKTETICSGTAFTTTVSSGTEIVPTGTLYTWTVAPVVGITGTSDQTTGVSSISQTLTNTTNAAINVVYNVTATSGTAPNACTDTFTVTVTVNPTPSISNKTETICSGTAFTTTPVNVGIEIVPTGTLYTWTIGTVSGINGASNQTTGVSSISQTLTNTTNAAINVIYNVTATSGTAPNACTDIFTVTVTVNPTPSISNKTETICSGTAFTTTPVSTGTEIVPIGTLYTWTVAPVVGITGTSDQTTGVSSISQTLTNSTNAVINVVYNVTATSGTTLNACTDTFTITVTVNPTPSISNKTETICSGTAFTTTPVNLGTEIVPTGTLYTWTVAPVVGITGTSDELVGVLNSISQTLTNSTNTAINVVYNVTATSGTAPNTCTDIFTVTVTVNPLPAITNKTETICSGTAFTTTPLNSGAEIVPTGTLYTWTVASVVGITGTSDQTTGVSSISQTLTNGTNAAINVVYNITATSGTAPNACTDTFTVTVTVNPTPSISNKTETICSSTSFTTTPVNLGTEIVPTGILYTWTVAPVVGITGTSDELVGVLNSISQTLTNSTNTAINVVYNVTATSGTAPNACTSTFTVTVTVKPNPTTTSQTDITVCSGDVIPDIDFTSTPTGATYTWTNDNVNTGLTLSSGSGSILAFLATNSTSSPIVSNITVLPTLNGCLGLPMTFKITVNPKPIINTPSPYHLCDENDSDNLTTFNLNVKDVEIKTNMLNQVVTYHTTLPDAESGLNPIPGSIYNVASTTGSQQIFVRVTDTAAPLCESITSFWLYVDPVPKPKPVITDYALCDYNSPGNGIELFDLTTKDTEVKNGQSNVVITYFATQSDAINGTPLIASPTAYPSSTQLVWFRITNSSLPTACYSIGSYQLVVNPLPVVLPLSDMKACSTTSQAVFDLTINDNLVTTTPSIITYYNSLPAAQSGTGALTLAQATNYTGSNNEIVFIRIEDSTTHCYTTSTVKLIVNQGPPVATTASLAVCDDNNDGQAQFDLQGIISQIFGLGNTTVPTGITLTVHTSFADSQTGLNPIPLNVLYSNLISQPWNQTLYFAATYDNTGCKTLGEIYLTVNRFPEAIALSDYHECDDNRDGITRFDLTTRIPLVLGTLSPTANAVTFYNSSLPDAEAGGTTGLIPSLSLPTYASISRTIWVRVTTTASGCYKVVELKLVVDPLPAILPSYKYELCETTAPIGKEFFNLDSKIAQIIGTQAGSFDVKFYDTLADATANPANFIVNSSNFENITVNLHTIGIRITNTATGCWTTSRMDLIVNPLPVLVAPSAPYTLCEPAIFNLCSLNAGLLNGNSYVLTYHDSQVNADANLAALPCNYTPSPANAVNYVYVRAENSVTGCYTVLQLELDINPRPIIAAISNYEKCDEDSAPQNGCTTFDLTTKNAEILALQPLAASNYIITYFSTGPNTGIINTPSNFLACGTKTVYFRVTNVNTGCFNDGQYIVKVNTPLALTTPTLLQICDEDANPNDLFTQFDIPTRIGLVSGHTLTYYTDASHTNQITNPSAFTNTVGPVQTIYVVATNDVTLCRSYRTLTLEVLPVPTPRTNPPAIPDVCENATGSGVQNIDLTINANYIKNSNSNVTLHYYPTLTDAENETNEIMTPNNALVGNPLLVGQVQYVYIAVASDLYIDTYSHHCTVIVAQPFKINPLPLVATIPVVEKCDYDANDTDGSTTFDLTDSVLVNSLIASNIPALTSYSIAYYTSLANATSGTVISNPSAYPSNTTLTNNTQTIYYIITNLVTGCKSAIGQFTIQVNPLPKAGVFTSGLETCDTYEDNDGYYLFDLTSLKLAILSGQNANDFTVTFHDNQSDADSDINQISDPANYLAYTHVVWIRVENNVTGCYRLTSYNIIIEKKPELYIISDTGSNVICYDFMTNQPVRTLNLTVTNTNPIPVTYQWYLDGVLLPGETADNIHAIIEGNYSVVATSTTTNACTTVQLFEVLKSGQAVGIQDGYIITNAFTENQTIVVNVVGFGDYLYSLDDGPRQPSNIFENVPFEPNPHTIYVWDNKGGYEYSCDPLIIENIHVIDYPHYFTPNGDGIHDTWNVVGLEDQPTAKIYIFDRFGKLLKQISPSDESQGWDGTFNGEPLPSTDYWFTIDFSENGAEKQFKAHFSLKR